MATSAEILPWVAIGIQGGLGLYVLGKAKGLLDAVTGQVGELKLRLTQADALTDDSLADRARLNARVAALEADHAHAEAQREVVAANVQKTREELAAFRATAEEQHRNMARAMEAVQRDLQGVNRQLANIAADRLGYRAPEPLSATPADIPRRRRSAEP